MVETSAPVLEVARMGLVPAQTLSFPNLRSVLSSLMNLG